MCVWIKYTIRSQSFVKRDVAYWLQNPKYIVNTAETFLDELNDPVKK